MASEQAAQEQQQEQGQQQEQQPEQQPEQQQEESEVGNIEVDTEALDGDSAYAESTHETDTETLNSSIVKYKWEHGRRYHAYGNGDYWGPNDEKQLDAEDMVHQMYLTIFNGELYLAPIAKEPHRVLDIGCGTGIWAVDFADLHPTAEVTGVDLSPVQPTSVPPNVCFEIDDINEEWTWGENTFDFIHVRMMVGSVPDWVAFYKKALRALKPGGWIQQAEPSMRTCSDDGTVAPDMPFTMWAEVFKKVGDMTGRTFNICEQAADGMRKAGLVDVTEKRYKLPIGPWPKDPTLKERGIWNRVFLTEALEGFALRTLTGPLGWTYAESQMFFQSMRAHFRDPKVHAWVPMYVSYGRKPQE